ncbi:hypothetical protein P153DRAFT_362945 [Dothidotthia symphoricarpi CBS 119687]|uniref:Uncharacterized protein n=1 Tax=Dothidotthia symphoricarpi CBS 119687 TaxID=1392245 RepID=A0A6A6ART5_9PLEO|nr:uncharacterized protein P153DRAFT_362945 [Dothidotthia symphoricarpi CBS 119687]KAF2133913.1 hypothetical protein P153DRAFT_362945 [Dothidotthia symphoricarpi CBS 119687]
MQPMLIHYCNCNNNTSVPYSSSIFSQNIACSNCGSISTGINIRPKTQADTNMQQDELAQLFSAHMNLSNGASQQMPQVQQQVQQQVQEEVVQRQETPKPIVYASSHYTHSYHVAAPSRSTSEPSNKTHIESSQLEAVLLRNSIDPSLLFPSQLDLFQNADDDQRLRLLELWRISPPTGRQGYPAGTDYNMSRQLYDWPPTSVAQEEAMAKLRYETQLAERAQQEEIQSHQQQLNQSMDRAAEQMAEPYMASGYEMMARREYDESAHAAENKSTTETDRYCQATDPVYNIGGTNGGLWQKNVGSLLDMEDNYGSFAYAREYGMQQTYGDEEMVM